MPRLKKKIPSYRLHKPSGQAIVTLGGKDFYLGSHGSQVSQSEYDRLIAEWPAHGRRLPQTVEQSPDLTVNDLILRYGKFAQVHYSRDGATSRVLDNIRDALRYVQINKPWSHATGPRTEGGKARSAANGKIFQKGPRSIRELRSELVEVMALVRQMTEFRKSLASRQSGSPAIG